MTDRPALLNVRDAGPGAMTSQVAEWDEVDERSDESFPASDPPAFSPKSIGSPDQAAQQNQSSEDVK